MYQIGVIDVGGVGVVGVKVVEAAVQGMITSECKSYSGQSSWGLYRWFDPIALPGINVNVNVSIGVKLVISWD